MKDRKDLTSTELRTESHRVIDGLAKGGVEQEVRAGSTSVLIAPVASRISRFENRRRRNALNCTPDELIATSWE